MVGNPLLLFARIADPDAPLRRDQRERLRGREAVAQQYGGGDDAGAADAGPAVDNRTTAALDRTADGVHGPLHCQDAVGHAAVDAGLRTYYTTAADLAARFGINIRDTAFWEGSLAVLRADIDRFDKLVP